MSVDTRTPRDLSVPEPVLNTVKVPCDPAQVVVNHASFRVEFASAPPVSRAVRLPAPAGRRRPLVWTGRSTPGNPGATALLHAVRSATRDTGATKVLPRVTASEALVAPRPPQPGETTRPLPVPPLPRPGHQTGTGIRPGPATGARPGPRAGQHAEQHAEQRSEPRGEHRVAGAAPERRRARAAAGGRQAFYPDRRVSLGVVLLPLRVLLGFIAVYAGMGKLTDPVYFDGGERGSLYAWLSSLEPWSLASPLHSWALSHPVGAGLTVAFTQITVGVLTVFGLWQRLAAALGAALSLALLVTVSWQHGPAYDTPDVIFFAAWTPLIIAGAPVYSLDARLAGEAWRTLGPRAPLPELRRRVLRRGAKLATLLLGLALLIGSTLGSAVRSSQTVRLPGPGEPPRNHLPGQPLPDEAGPEDSSDEPSPDEDGGEPSEAATTEPEDSASPSDAAEGTPDRTGEAPPSTVEAPPVTEQTVPAPEPPPAPREPAPEPAAPEPPASAPEGGEAPPSSETGETPDEGGDESSLGPIGGLLG